MDALFPAEHDLQWSRLLSELEEQNDGLNEGLPNSGSAAVSKRKAEKTANSNGDVDSLEGPLITPRKRVRPDSRGTPQPKKLACLFFKRDKHKLEFSRSCGGPGFKTLARLKEHLTRCHMQSENQCNRCHRGFQSVSELAAHQRAVIPCALDESTPSEGITKDHLSRMNFRGESKASEEEKWELMYRIVFPADKIIPSPYYDEACGNCIPKILEDFHQYQMRMLPDLICREMDVVSHHEPKYDLPTRIPDIVQRVNSELNNDFVSSRGIQLTRLAQQQSPSQPREEEIRGLMLDPTLSPHLFNELWSHEALQLALDDNFAGDHKLLEEETPDGHVDGTK